jgi:hypothetical protein
VQVEILAKLLRCLQETEPGDQTGTTLSCLLRSKLHRVPIQHVQYIILILCSFNKLCCVQGNKNKMG